MNRNVRKNEYFRHYIHRIDKVEYDKCVYCGICDNAEHTVYECKRWREKRMMMSEELGRSCAARILWRYRDSHRKSRIMSRRIKKMVSKKEIEERIQQAAWLYLVFASKFCQAMPGNVINSNGGVLVVMKSLHWYFGVPYYLFISPQGEKTNKFNPVIYLIVLPIFSLSYILLCFKFRCLCILIFQNQQALIGEPSYTVIRHVCCAVRVTGLQVTLDDDLGGNVVRSRLSDFGFRTPWSVWFSDAALVSAIIRYP